MNKKKFIRKKIITPVKKAYSQLNELMTKNATNNSSPKKLLQEIVKQEKKRKSAHHSFGFFLEEYMLTDGGLQKLGNEANMLLIKYPNSILLNYLKVVSLAETGNIEKAHKHISDTIITFSIKKSNFTYPIQKKQTEAQRKQTETQRKRTVIALLSIWRTLDLIAKRHMQWASGDNQSPTQYKTLDFLSTLTLHDNDDFYLTLNLSYAEPILQGKNHKEYLQLCQSAFDNVDSLAQELTIIPIIVQKLRIITAMCRMGIRRLPSYTNAYALAIKSYNKIKPSIDGLITKPFDEIKTPVAFVQLLSSVMGVTKLLSLDDDLKKAQNTLINFSLSENGNSTIWSAAFSLAQVEPVGNFEISKRILNSTKKKPKKTPDMKNFLGWANLTQQYQIGYDFFSKKSDNVKLRRCSGEYIKILQKLGKFKEAKKINSNMHAKILTAPYTMDPYTSWALTRKSKELTFLEKTAEIYSTVAQPSNPKGVIFVTTINIELLTLVPLVVLIELKRMGWAVIPLVEGLLPKEKTGIDAIDCFIGCITLDRKMSLASEESFNKINKLDYRASDGYLKWDDIDLSHILWEDATINRRVYHPDYNCPKSQEYLGNLVQWAECSATVLHNARINMQDLNLRAGFIIDNNARLPGALYRLYCEKKGDPDNFFCLHSTSAYQNYFTNFSTNISTQSIMRNMTRHPETRSALFPVPIEFETHYQQHKAQARDILQRVKDITKVKRSTAGIKELPPEAIHALEKIKTWKHNGGKVACAFGKVVFDSSVIYDGGPAHKNMEEWINHTIEAVKDSNTLLLIKPHPHELNQEIASFPNEYFSDLIKTELNENVIIIGHRWFDLHMLKDIIDIGLIYNGTTSIELGIMGIPSILCSYFAPIDYPIGHAVPISKSHYESMVQFREEVKVATDIKERAAVWLEYMSGKDTTFDYRYHSRQITNKIVYPHYWFDEDVEQYFELGDKNVTKLALIAIS